MQCGIDGVFLPVSTQTGTATYLNFNEAIVHVQARRRRRSAASDTVFAYQYGVSASNNGVNFGSDKYVTVLDTTCQETADASNGDTVVRLKVYLCCRAYTFHKVLNEKRCIIRKFVVDFL